MERTHPHSLWFIFCWIPSPIFILLSHILSKVARLYIAKEKRIYPWILNIFSLVIMVACAVQLMESFISLHRVQSNLSLEHL